jgi:RNA polymerase sigma-70 factor, ECF subfamily
MHMSAEQIDLDCLRKAQRGCQESRSLLAQQAKGKVYTFIYRTAMDRDLSEDLTQETLLELIRSLPRLQLTSVSGFWSWVYRTALGKVQHHFREQGAKRMEQRTRVNSEMLETMPGKRQTGPAGTLWRKEMVAFILEAMGALNLEYRTVLTLRCLEEQSYAEIAMVLGGSQMRAKMLFYRAKTALRKQLARKGLSRSHFLGALTVFGTVTSTSTRSAAAIPSITAASAKATVSGAVLGTLLSKAALIGMSIALAITGTGIILSTTGVPFMRSVRRNPAIPPWPGPGQPQFDSYMYFMGGQTPYVTLGDIAASHNPDQDGWRCLGNPPREQDVQRIAALKDKPSNATLVLEQDHWIEYRIPTRLLDWSGPEIGLFVLHWGTLPSVFLTDGGQRLQEISVTHYRARTQVPELIVLGFDLSDVAVDFDVRGIRITGHGSEGPFAGCAIIKLAVSLARR